MSTTFSRSMRSLAADGFRRSMLGLLLVAVLLGAGVAWFFLARVALYEVTETARLEVAWAVHPVEAAITLGQSARVRLEGFPWTQYGSISAAITSVADEPRYGRIRVELAVHPHPASLIPLQHGLPGTVEVEVDKVSPATLVLRAAGRLLAGPRAANRGEVER